MTQVVQYMEKLRRAALTIPTTQGTKFSPNQNLPKIKLYSLLLDESDY